MINKEEASGLYQRIAAAAALTDPAAIIREYRAVLEVLFKQLTLEDHRSFSNLYARIEFVFDKEKETTPLKAAVNGLRAFSNSVNYNDTPITEENLLLGLRTVAEAIHYFSDTPAPALLQQHYAPVAENVWQITELLNAEATALDKVLVLAIGATGIHCKSASFGAFFLEFGNSDSNDFHYLKAILRPYDTLRIIGAGRTDDSGEHYVCLPDTQIVLEPDLLLDISDLAECFTAAGLFPLNFLIRKLVPVSLNEAALKGNMVNAIFDAAIRDQDLNFKDVFKEAVADQVFQAASYGKATLNKIYSEIYQDHWDNLSEIAADLRKRPVRIEPSFFTSTYGLQGRLDVMVEDEQDNNRKEIIELKSGRAPLQNTWVNHGMQVVGYNMLLKSAFGATRRGASAILYSAAKYTPLRNVTTNLIMENRLLRVRNQAVAWLMELAKEDYNCLDLIRPEAATGLPAYAIRDYALYFEAYTNATDSAKAYYRTYLSFVMREYLRTKCGMYAAAEREEGADGFAGLWLKQEAEKVATFNIISRLQFESLASSEYLVKFRITHRQQHNFRAGDTILLYPRKNGKLEPQLQQIVKGRMESITSTHVVLSLINHQLDASYFSKYACWALEHDVYESNFWFSTRALMLVLQPSNTKRFDLLLGNRAPEFRSFKPVTPHNLNKNQQEILSNALAAESYYLLQGPPGTGKTSTMIMQLVQSFFEEGRTTVLVAFTNRAVEEIGEKLRRLAIPFMRLGSRNTASEQSLRSYCKDGNINAALSLIRDHKIFLATVSTMTSRLDQWRLFGKEPDVLIVDEASQLTEPQLIPLLMVFKKFILVGDQNQLPAVITQHESFCSVKDPLLIEQGIIDVRTSFFERLMTLARNKGWNNAYGMLTTHFRMHEHIAGLINHYYAGRLKSGTSLQLDNNLPVSITNGSGCFEERVFSSGRMVFIPSPPETNARFHIAEARRVVNLLVYLQSFYGQTFNVETVGVITPWRTQISAIQTLLAAIEGFPEVQIDTVERFQGAEKDIIIVSMAVNHTAQLKQLLSKGIFEDTLKSALIIEENASLIEVDRKLLVTMSRARKQIILLGDPAILGVNKHYKAAIKKMTIMEY